MIRDMREKLLFPAWLGFLGLMLAAALVGAFFVFTRGLVVTNLTDLVPWGLWITIDLSAVALGAGAFLLSAAVYLLRIKQLEPVARTAVFIGFTGYTMACMTLLLDIGRPDRFWHSLVFWNIHSPLWEVTMCISFYLMVLTLEVLPIIGHQSFVRERFPWVAARLESVHSLAPVLAVVGLGLSLLHQSSLGATYGVLKARPIVYKEMMPILFIVSAIAAGPALTVLASKLAARLTPRAHVDDALLDKISHFIGWALLGYLYLRFWDTLAMNYTFEPGRTEGLLMLTSGSLAFTFWIGEILLGTVVPSVILLNKRLRRRPNLHILALVLVIGGLVAYRWNTNIVSQLVVFNMLPNELAPVYTSYRPSLVEIATGAGVISYGLLMFTLGVRYLNIVDHRKHGHAVQETTVSVDRAPVPVAGD